MKQTTDNPKIYIGESPGLGLGLFTRRKLFAGERIATFDGEVYQWNDIHDTIPADLPGNPRDHAIQFTQFGARDSNGFARYANHSCRPNCGIVDRFDLVAVREILPGDEILWDYDMTEDSVWFMDCACREDCCRGRIAGYRFLPPGIRQRYRKFTSEWLLEEPRKFVGTVDAAYERHRVPLVPGRLAPPRRRKLAKSFG